MSKNPYLTIWLRPLDTFKFHLGPNSKFNFVAPVLLISIPNSVGLSLETEGGLLLKVFVGVLSALFAFSIVYFLIPWLLLWVGKLWIGNSSFESLQKVVALSVIVQLPLYAHDLLIVFDNTLSNSPRFYFALNLLLGLVFLRVLIIGIAYDQKFDYKYAAMNIVVFILPFFILQVFRTI